MVLSKFLKQLKLLFKGRGGGWGDSSWVLRQGFGHIKGALRHSLGTRITC